MNGKGRVRTNQGNLGENVCVNKKDFKNTCRFSAEQEWRGEERSVYITKRLEGHVCICHLYTDCRKLECMHTVYQKTFIGPPGIQPEEG